MRFVFLVEGHTEKKCLAAFLKRWLDPRLPQTVGIDTVRSEGWPELLKDLPTKAPLHLRRDDVIAVIALLDLYGPSVFPEGLDAVARGDWGRKKYEALIDDRRFRLHFAVHETEAWVLADPSLLPEKVRKALPGRAKLPETVNHDEPPAKLLGCLYKEKTGISYRKVIDGADLFRRLDPEKVYQGCPSFRAMMDDLLALALARQA